MPTGYTHSVQDGTVTDFRTFALQCARNFGALVDMRDEPMTAPIPAKLVPDTRYHDERIAHANAVLVRVPAMTEAECENAAQKKYAADHAEWIRRNQIRKLQRQRYEAMLDKVRAWQAPEACEYLRSFMAEQLITSIKHDCDGKYADEPQQNTGAEWRNAQLAAARRDVDYHARERAEIIQRCEKRNLWLDALHASLVDIGMMVT